jgi:EAL domain-containing protein (putative c-di-GMP-specific phosphodiesterase class I)
LRNAIESDEFIVHYQPRVDTKTGRLCSLEALVRWQHPERGLVMPTEFISLAEETGLIVQLGENVLHKVGEQISLWRSQGGRVVPVSVNVSPRQLQFGRTAACISEVLQSFNIESRLLEIEITESTMVDNTPIVLQELESIQKLGVRLMIDDFGTGYSSLAQLHRMDVDTLKVDQAFTQALSRGSEGELMYRAIVSMAAALKMCVVAEGVETLEQLRLLQTIGCDEVQGYIISRALPAADIMQLVSKNILPPFDRVGRLVAVGPH